MKEKELKPCPFCENEFLTINYQKITNTYYVACPHCKSVFRSMFLTREEAERALNSLGKSNS